MFHPAQKEKTMHEQILVYLKSNPRGLTMTELVKGTKYSRKALEKHLHILILENEIYNKQFGSTKVYYPNHRVHHLDFERFQYDDKTVWFNILENEYGRYLFIQKKKLTDGEWLAEHSITIPLNQAKGFLKALEKTIESERIKSLIGQEENKLEYTKDAK